MFENVKELEALLNYCRIWLPERRIVFTTKETQPGVLVNKYDSTMYTVVQVKKVVNLDMNTDGFAMMFIDTNDEPSMFMHFGEFSVEGIEGMIVDE